MTMVTTYQRPLARTCIDCGVALPPERRGFYCETHGREGNGAPISKPLAPMRPAGNARKRVSSRPIAPLSRKRQILMERKWRRRGGSG
jgi:hypothetical protein